MSRSLLQADYIGKRNITLSEAEVTIASATTTDIGAVAANRVAISGTTTITSFGTTANVVRLVRFTGALTLTYNATTLILPGAANITTAAGDTAIFSSDGSGNWRCLSYTKGTIAPATVSTYTSADQTIVTGGLVTVAHGLGLVPKIWQAVIRCKTAEFGYSVGDEVFASFQGGDGISLGVASVNSTNFYFTCYQSGIRLVNKSGVGATVNTATNANWALVFRAIVL